MKNIHAFHVVERGARHILEDLPLQDAAFSEKEEMTDVNSQYQGEYAIAVISDGHGSPQYFRSDRGAEFAYKAAAEALHTVMKNAKDITTSKNQENLKKLIYHKWFERVKEDWQREPFTEAEFDRIRQKMQNADSRDKEKMQYYLAKYRAGDAFQKAYGCTLAAVLFCEKYTIAVQIGDGTCVAFYPDGSCNQPIPPDSKSMANQTSSLCDLRPDDCRVHIFKKEPMAVFVASDGIDDSFGQGEGLYNFYRDICINFAEKNTDYEKTLQERLFSISKARSKDDISIAGIYDLEKLIKLKPILENMYQRGEKQIKLNELKDNQNGVSDYSLNTARMTMEKFEKEVKQNQTEISSLQIKIDFLKKSMDRILRWFSDNFVPNKRKEREEKIKKFNETIAEINYEIQEYQEKIAKLESKRNGIQNFLNNLIQNHNQLAKDKESIIQHEQNILTIEKKKDENEQKYAEAKATYDNLMQKRNTGIQEHQRLTNDISKLTNEINQQLREMKREEQEEHKPERLGTEESKDTNQMSSENPAYEDIQRILSDSEKTEESSEKQENEKVTEIPSATPENSSSMYQEDLSVPQTKDELLAEADKFAEQTKSEQNSACDGNSVHQQKESSQTSAPSSDETADN